MTETFFTDIEIGKLACLVNNLGIIGGQLIVRHRSDQFQRAHINLQNFRRHNQDLLQRVHVLARKSNDESALRLTEDLERMPPDVAQALALARRCLLATAFLGHCMATADRPAIQPAAAELAKTLH